MNLIFVSNFITPHQSPFGNYLYKKLDGNFHFLETVHKNEKLPIGWRTDGEFPYVVTFSELSRQKDLWKQRITDADVVMIGSAPDEFISERLKQGKLTFRYSERIYKNGCRNYELPARAVKYFWKHGRHKNLYLLCASAYTAGDYAKTGTFLNKTYKWGYFPETKHYDIHHLMSGKQHEVPQILWVGRFLDLKHPDDAVRVAKLLKQDGYAFELNFIGTGDMEVTLEQMIAEYGLQDCVHLLGTMAPEQVRAHMEQANIYLFTSDRGEGWGAVLNESMNSGCAVVASHAIGSVPFLMKDGENGLIYRSGDVDMLYEKTKYLLDHPEEQLRLGQAAYQTMVETWNAEVAAERFLTLVECIQNGTETPYTDGPCSRAQILTDEWF